MPSPVPRPRRRPADERDDGGFYPFFMVSAHRHEDDAGKGFPAILGRRQVSDKDVYGLYGVALGGLAEQVQVGQTVRQAGFQGGQDARVHFAASRASVC